jgi:alpha-ketoglutarate-dependent 2,4-dichlorophenoxyacetate dioxygenase
MSVTTSLKMRQVGPCFAAEVEGIDLRQPLTPDEVAAIHAGMDQYAVLVFHDQYLTDEQHMAFTLSLGELENTTGNNLRESEELRIPATFFRCIESRQGQPCVRSR